MKKSIGILCQVSSLPNKYGIGDFGKCCYEFIDFLKENKFSIWQILPLSETNVHNCPYGSMSFFALDSMYIDPEDLYARNLIKKEDLASLSKFNNSRKVDFGVVKKEKNLLIEKAFENITDNLISEINKFVQKFPIFKEYAVYKTLLETYKTKDYRIIDNRLWISNSKERVNFENNNQRLICKYLFTQYLLFTQWTNVYKYAKKHGIKILGDMPIYPEPTSFDVFAYPQYFLIDQKTRIPKVFGGVPADDFSSTSQNWGTCVYNWEYLKQHNYDFLISKIKMLLKYYDLLRLDHYFGYVNHFEIDVKNPSKGVFVKHKGSTFFDHLKEQTNIDRFVIEDLGYGNAEAEQIKQKYDLEGMKVLQFAFDKNSSHMPENAGHNNIYYLGTHDNNTFIGFLDSLSRESKTKYLSNMQIKSHSNKAISIECMQKIISSNVKAVVFQIQDLLFEGAEHRMNIPGQAAGCWEYRAPKKYQKQITQNLTKILF